MTMSRIHSPRIDVLRSALFACAFVLVLASCRPASNTETSQNDTPTHTAAKPEAFAIVAEFSAKDTVAAERDRRILRWAESGCGMSPVVKTSSMLLDDPVLQPDFVAEYAADGRVVRTWGKPFNAPVGHLSGDRIVFEQWQPDSGRSLRYWTDTEGRIGPIPETTVATKHPSIDEGKQVDCPSIELFGEDSDYLQCFEAVDAQTKHIRRIALEGACT